MVGVEEGHIFPILVYFQLLAGRFLVLVLTGSKFIIKDLYDSLQPLDPKKNGNISWQDLFWVEVDKSFGTKCCIASLSHPKSQFPSTLLAVLPLGKQTSCTHLVSPLLGQERVLTSSMQADTGQCAGRQRFSDRLGTGGGQEMPRHMRMQTQLVQYYTNKQIKEQNKYPAAGLKKLFCEV